VSAAGPPKTAQLHSASGGSAAASAASVGAHPIPAVLLMGPTASGKSALAMAIAQRSAAEIVSVDSAQVYRGMDIGTAKPDAAARARVPHHLIDIVDPTDAYSAARFRSDAIRAIAGIRARGAVPLVVGGTMLYFKALHEGLSALPAADPVLRARISARAASEGWPELHAELARIDPPTAARIEPTDAQRIQRALEVCELAGRPLSELQGAREAQGALGSSIAVALVPKDRAALHAQIARRFDAMLAAGLVAELAALRTRYALIPDLPSMRCVGYRQAWEFLDGRIDAPALRERGIAATRQLAKRQYTWLRATPATVFDSAIPDLHDAVAAFLAREGVIPT
jgi:tRNA dimethylallyltransferase